MNIKKLLFLLLCTVIAASLASCLPSESRVDELPEMQYQIVYPMDADRLLLDQVERLQRELLELHGVSLRTVADHLSSGYQYEILVGNTDRQVGRIDPDELGNDGWTVRRVGDAIVVNGASVDAIGLAVDEFINRHSFDEGKVYLKKEDTVTKKQNNPDYSAGLTLKVGSYNILHGREVDLDMSRLAADILACGLDVVGLQEVDNGTRRVGGRDLLPELARACGYEHYAFFAAMDYDGGEYGIGIISKYPIVSTDMKRLTVIDGTEPRVLAHAVIEVSGIKIDFFNTHLSFETTEIRATQLSEILAAMGESRTAVLTGDFNLSSTAEIDMALPDHRRANRKNLVTFPSDALVIDEIVCARAWSITDCSVYDVRGNSDHNMLTAEIRYDGGCSK